MKNKTCKTRKARSTKMNKTRKCSWGYHLIIDSSNCDRHTIRSKDTIAKFVKTLVKCIDMVAYGPPKIVMFGTGNKKGYTLVQLIETSNITAHFVEETNDVYLDIFSCKKFKKEDAIKCIRQFFNPQGIKMRFIKRQA